MSKFINPCTDIGFKRIFGQEVSKPVLITFLNALLEGEHQFTGDDFDDVKQVDEPKTKEEAVEALKYKITVYFSDVTELTELKFAVKDGCCTATAVGFEGEDDIVYAGYPADSDSEEGFASLDEAFEAAKKIN